MKPRKVCECCGTWVCWFCSWERRNANRSAQQSCANCGKSEGDFRAVYHHNPLRHTEADR